MPCSMKRNEMNYFELERDSDITGPQWFSKKLKASEIIMERFIVDGACKVKGCSIACSNGWLHAKVGDFIVQIAPGIIIPVSKGKFEQVFEKRGKEEPGNDAQ